MEFPLTLAVLPVFYLRLRNDTYALPVSSIENLIDLRRTAFIAWRSRHLSRFRHPDGPIVDLGAILQNNPLRIGAKASKAC